MKKLIPVAIIAGIALVWPAFAASQDRPRTPQNWDYEIVDGKRVPKAKRTVNPDGSWREEKRDGKCIEIKEMSAAGELKITRKCDDEG
ncbi:MAG: hypothetical protein HKO13_04640 [Sphingomonas sp.]|nr:hypothetical protein [Sphingomonas sp.]RZV51096.1 MAG: hypothetical protein EX258_04315 [Sphingomonadaceae bacterium]